MTTILLAIIIFAIAFVFFLVLFSETVGLGTVYTKIWCFSYCAMKITEVFWGGAMPGDFCGCP